MGCGSSSTQGQVIETFSQQDLLTSKRAENQVSQAENQANKAENQVNQAVNQANQAENQVNKAENQVNQAVNQANQAENQVNKAENQVNQAVNQANQAENQANQAENQVNQAVNQANQAENQVNKAENQVNQAVNQANQAENQANKAENQVNQAIKQANQAENQANKVENQVNQAVNQANKAAQKPTAINEKSDSSEAAKVNEEEECGDCFDAKLIKLSPITIPEVDNNKELPVYTIDDIANNNGVKGKNNWFVYGRHVYSLDLFTPIVIGRVQQYLNMTNQYRWPVIAVKFCKRKTYHFGGWIHIYPVYGAREYGVRREEMDKVLPACRIGKLGAISREEYLSRLKEGVDSVKSDLEARENLSEYLVDYLEHLSQWLSSYPNVELKQPVDKTNVDPNQCEFPLPDKIRADPTVMRKWARNWIEFDMTVEEGGAWPLVSLLNEDWGDVHQTYADICAEQRDDVNLPQMNMEIEGEAAWHVIKLDVVKNDETTGQQDNTWKAKERRKDLNDPKRMKRRRKQIADNFLKRHVPKCRLKAETMVAYENWANRLEEHWKEFQELCETFVPKR